MEEPIKRKLPEKALRKPHRELLDYNKEYEKRQPDQQIAQMEQLRPKMVEKFGFHFRPLYHKRNIGMNDTPQKRPILTRISGWIIFYFLSGIVTALIQFNPVRVQALLENHFGNTNFGEFQFFAWLSAAFITLLFFAFHGKDRREIADLFCLIEKVHVKVLAFFILLCLILPQRMMDNNSAYINIPSGSSLAWLLFFLDVSRGIACFKIWILLAAGGEPITQKHKTGFYFLTNRWVLHGIILFFFLATASIQTWVLEGIPHVQDEVIQDWHARLLAAGYSRAPEIPCLNSFSTWGLEANGKWLYSIFQPGFTIVLTLFHLFARPDFANPLLGVLALLLFKTLLAETHGEKTAFLATIMMAFSPFLLLMASGRMNHVFALVLFLSACFGSLESLHGNAVKGTLLTGLACGTAFMTRRADGASMLAAVTATFFFSSPSRRKKLGVFTGTLLIFLIIFKIQTLFSLNNCGDPLQMFRHIAKMAVELPDTSVFSLIQNFWDNVLGLNVFAFGGLFPAFLGLFFLNFGKEGKEGDIERLLLFHISITALVYSGYDYQDFCYGPRFFFLFLPCLCLGWALALSKSIFFYCNHQPVFLKLLGLSGAVFLMCTQIWANLGNRFWNMDRSFENFLAREIREPSIVFLKSSTRSRLEVARLLAKRGIERDVIAEAVVSGAVDYEGLKSELSRLPLNVASETILREIGKFREDSRFNQTIDFEISESEIVRLNTCDPFSQKVVIARDLGDEPNFELISRLPRHKPLLVIRRKGTFLIFPHTHCGVKNFE